MKKTFFYLLLFLGINIIVGLAANTRKMVLRQQYAEQIKELDQLKTVNQKLVRETAHLSSLQRISKLSAKLELKRSNSNLVYIKKDNFAMR